MERDFDTILKDFECGKKITEEELRMLAKAGNILTPFEEVVNKLKKQGQRTMLAYMRNMQVLGLIRSGLYAENKSYIRSMKNNVRGLQTL